MPEEQYGKTFDKLFKFLLDKGLVTLGLYRLVGAQDNFTHPYVYTNPGAKTIVTPKDRVFVLGKDIPKDFIIDTSKLGKMEYSKNKDKPSEQASSVDIKQTAENGALMMPHTKDFYGLRSMPHTPMMTSTSLQGSDQNLQMSDRSS